MSKDQLDLIDLGSYSPEEARMIATALTLREYHLTNDKVEDDFENVAGNYKALAYKVGNRMLTQLGLA